MNLKLKNVKIKVELSTDTWLMFKLSNEDSSKWNENDKYFFRQSTLMNYDILHLHKIYLNLQYPTWNLKEIVKLKIFKNLSCKDLLVINKKWSYKTVAIYKSNYATVVINESNYDTVVIYKSNFNTVVIYKSLENNLTSKTKLNSVNTDYLSNQKTHYTNGFFNFIGRFESFNSLIKLEELFLFQTFQF